jgi:hypothetical protein
MLDIIVIEDDEELVSHLLPRALYEPDSDVEVINVDSGLGSEAASASGPQRGAEAGFTVVAGTAALASTSSLPPGENATSPANPHGHQDPLQTPSSYTEQLADGTSSSANMQPGPSLSTGGLGPHSTDPKALAQVDFSAPPSVLTDQGANELTLRPISPTLPAPLSDMGSPGTQEPNTGASLPYRRL